MRTSRNPRGGSCDRRAPYGPASHPSWQRSEASERQRSGLGGPSLATFGQILGLLDILAFFAALMLIGR